MNIIAPTLESGANRTGGTRPPGSTVDTAESLIAVGALTGRGIARYDADSAAGGQLVVHPPTARHDSSEDGCGRGVPIIPIQDASAFESQNGIGIGTEGDPMFTLDGRGTHAVAVGALSANGVGTCGADDNQAQANHLIPFDTTQITSALNRSQPREGDPMHPLQAGAHAPAIAFTERSRTEGRTFEAQEELSYALTNPGGGGRAHSRSIAGGFGVRRLTPLECSRLQGFPDDWLDGMGLSDSAKYRMLGNSVAVPCVAWIARRMVAATEQQLEEAS